MFHPFTFSVGELGFLFFFLLLLFSGAVPFLRLLFSERERECRDMLFATVPCNASINKSSASHFCPVRVRILWLLAAVYCLSLPFTYRTLSGRASLSPPSLPCPFHFQLTQARFHFLVSYSASVKGTVVNSMLSRILSFLPTRD